VEVVRAGDPRARLGCADEPALADCGAEILDRVVVSDAGCVREARGMRGAWRLALGAPLDVNRATARELSSLDGLGERLAAAIVADREAHGPFPDTGALRRVAGIGPKKAAGLAPQLSVD
jgi:competence protein ComEA